MKDILEAYKEKLDREISAKKAEVRTAINISEEIDKIRNDLSLIGKNLLSMFYQELVRYVEEKNPDFIKNNKDKWDEILDKANALREYGLYVAPIELLKEENKTLPIAVGTGAFIAAGVLTKLLLKRIKIIPAVIVGAIGGVGYNIFFGEDENKKREMLEQYIDDAYDWIKTALENMYKIFQDAV